MLMLEARALAHAGERERAKTTAAEALAIQPRPTATEAAMLARLERIAKEGRDD